jgi:hypothetical protein
VLHMPDEVREVGQATGIHCGITGPTSPGRSAGLPRR